MFDDWNDDWDLTPEEAGENFLNCIKGMIENIRNNPEAFRFRKPGLYIGGIRFNPGDTIVIDNHGLPQIIRKGCCE